MPLEKVTDFFVRQEKILASMSLACGKRLCDGSFFTASAAEGVCDESGKNVDANTIYDLASLTKLFTGIAVEIMFEKNVISPSDKVRDIVHQFTGLDVTCDEVLGFQLPLRTLQRIDEAENPEEGRQRLFSAYVPKEKPGEKRYSDIHSMVLKYVIEEASGQSYMDFVRENVLIPLEMNSTYGKVPESEVTRCCSYDREYRINSGRWVCRTRMKKGIPHDPKATIIQGSTDNVCGHAGIFSTLSDMQRLCQGILSGKIISIDRLISMSENRTGRQNPDGSFTQFLGCQCYRRHPVQYYSEIPEFMTDNAIGLSGFTGNHISIDPGSDTYVVMLGNRVMDRLTVVTPESEIESIGLKSDGRGRVTWTDGREIISSVNYVHLKDKYMHREIAGLLNKVC